VFNSKTLEVIPVPALSAPFFFFLFNAIYTLLDVVKIGMLFFFNWWNKFEGEEIEGGYFLQILSLLVFVQHPIQALPYSVSREEFAGMLTNCIRLEQNIINGRYLTQENL
jgi:hypothetical protein